MKKFASLSLLFFVEYLFISILIAQEGQQVRLYVETGHNAAVQKVVFSPNGELLISCDGNSIHIWDVKNKQELISIDLTSQGLDNVVENEYLNVIVEAAVSTDNKTLVIGSMNGVIRKFDIETGRQLRTFSIGSIKDGHEIAFCRKGSIVAAGVKDDLEIWNINSGLQILKLNAKNEIAAISFSSDCNILGTGTADGTVNLWDVKTGREVKSFKGEGYAISSIAFSHNGKTLAIGRKKFLKLLDIESQRELKTIIGERRDALDRDWSPDDFRSIKFSEDDTVIASGITNHYSSPSFLIKLWDVKSGKEIKTFSNLNDSANSIDFSPDNNLIASGGEVEGNVKLWNVTKKQESILKSNISTLSTAAFSPNGEKLVCGTESGDIKLWKLTAETTLINLKGHSEPITSVVFSPDEKIIASGSWDESVRLWDAQIGKELKILREQTNRVVFVTFSKDGKKMASVASSGYTSTIIVYDTTTWKPLDYFDFNDPEVKAEVKAEFPEIYDESDESFILSSDRKLQAKIVGSGLIRLNRIDSEEYLSLFALDKENWIVTTSEGRFDTNKSLDQIQGLHWIVNDEALKPLSLDVFMRQYYEPSLLQRVLTGEQFKSLPSIADINRVQPKVAIKEIKSSANVTDLVDVTVEVESVKEDVSVNATDRTKKKQLVSGAYDLRLFRDGQLVGSSAPTNLLEKYIKDAPQLVEQGKASKALINTPEDKAWRAANDLSEVVKFVGGKATYTFKNVKLPHDGKREIEFSAYAFNADRVKSDTARQTYKIEKPEIRAGKTYLVTIGVNASENQGYKLNYAANDARKMQEILGAGLEGAGRKVVKIPLVSDYDAKGKLAENAATKPIIKAVFDLLAGNRSDVPKEILAKIPNEKNISPVQPEDALIITYSGHGYADRSGIFYMLPYDIGETADLKRAIPNMISSDELSLWMRDITAKEMLMVVDACHSAAAGQGEGFKPGPMGSRGLGQLAYDKGMKILSATQADNVALELGSLQQGLLSYALLKDGIADGKADDEPKDKKLFSKEWLAYAVKRVPELYQGIGSGNLKNVKINGKSPTEKERSGVVCFTKNCTVKTQLQQPSLFDFNRKQADNLLINLPEKARQ